MEQGLLPIPLHCQPRGAAMGLRAALCNQGCAQKSGDPTSCRPRDVNPLLPAQWDSALQLLLTAQTEKAETLYPLPASIYGQIANR